MDNRYPSDPKFKDNLRFKKVLNALNREFQGSDYVEKPSTIDKPDAMVVEPQPDRILPPDEFEINRQKALEEIGRKERAHKGLPEPKQLQMDDPQKIINRLNRGR